MGTDRESEEDIEMNEKSFEIGQRVRIIGPTDVINYALLLVGLIEERRAATEDPHDHSAEMGATR